MGNSQRLEGLESSKEGRNMRGSLGHCRDLSNRCDEKADRRLDSEDQAYEVSDENEELSPVRH